jgi:pilus assembly protein TadC
MTIKKIKVDADDIEIINKSKTNNTNPKITRIKADEEYKENTNESFNEKFSASFGGSQNIKNNPIGSLMNNIEEIKKIKPYFFFSLLFGIIALFTVPEYLGPLAIIFGGLDLWKGSKLTKTVAYLGIFFGLIALIVFFK